MSVGVIGYPKVGRHSVIKTICDASPLYQADRQNYDDLNAVRVFYVNELVTSN